MLDMRYGGGLYEVCRRLEVDMVRGTLNLYLRVIGVTRSTLAFYVCVTTVAGSPLHTDSDSLSSLSSLSTSIYIAAMARITIIENSKVQGFQLKETAEDREKGRKVFSRVELPTGISREEVERVRAGWPQSARLRQRPHPRIDKIRTVILKEGAPLRLCN
jgi:hypothetical protein